MNITVNGISVNYTLEGLLWASHHHEQLAASNLSMWEPQMTVLTSHYRVLRYDTRGHGETDATAGPTRSMS